MTEGFVTYLALHSYLLVLIPLTLATVFFGLRVDSAHPHNEE